MTAASALLGLRSPAVMAGAASLQEREARALDNAEAVVNPEARSTALTLALAESGQDGDSAGGAADVSWAVATDLVWTGGAEVDFSSAWAARAAADARATRDADGLALAAYDPLVLPTTQCTGLFRRVTKVHTLAR